MPNKHCCYGKCKNDSRHAGREHMQGVFWINFPKPKTNLDKCKRWISLCGRKNFGIDNITKNTVICSKHFVGENGPQNEHPDPLPAAVSQLEVDRFVRKRSRPPPTPRQSTPKGIKKRLIHVSPASSHMADHDYGFVKLKDNPDLSVSESDSHTDDTDDISLDDTHGDLFTSGIHPLIESRSIETQTDVEFDHLKSYSDENLVNRSSLKRKLFMDDVLADDKSCKFYTGLTIPMLSLVFNLLKPVAEKMNYWEGHARQRPDKNTDDKKKRGPSRILSLYEELVLSLVRIRRAMDTECLQDLFGVSQTRVSRVFATWINLMYHELNFLIRWPNREQIAKKLPDCFKPFRKTRAIIDCTEIFVQKPSLPSSQRVTWSSYKHHNTFKALVSIAPTGGFSFVSKLWSGCASDRKLVEESGFLDQLEFGDDVMADRGFMIRDALALRHATLNVPPFAHGSQLSNKAATKTRRIARARIHVERAIGRMKQFKILQMVLPLNLKPLMDQIVFVCAALCNLDKKLVK